MGGEAMTYSKQGVRQHHLRFGRYAGSVRVKDVPPPVNGFVNIEELAMTEIRRPGRGRRLVETFHRKEGTPEWETVVSEETLKDNKVGGKVNGAKHLGSVEYPGEVEAKAGHVRMVDEWATRS